MQTLTEDARKRVAEIAAKHGVSVDAAEHLLQAIAAGRGTQAQFNHPDLGGMGQWSRGGMIMVGDMFNQSLKAKVDALCNELADALGKLSVSSSPGATQSQSGSRWPADLGTPGSSGSQNDMHYALFPDTHRLAIERAGKVTVHDTSDHRIHGFSQQQGGDQTLTFTSQSGPIRLDDLPVVDSSSGTNTGAPASGAAQASGSQTAGSTGSRPHEDTLDALDRLASLRDKGVITAADFDAKKAELLARL